MATPVIMPKQGNTVDSCLIVGWSKRQGERIQVGEPLLEIETDKAIVEIESPATGVLLERYFADGDEVPVQTTIAVIGEPGEDTAAFAPAGAAAETNRIPAAPTALPVNAAGATLPPTDATAGSSASAGATPTSPRARNLAARHALDPGRLSGSGPGGRVIERDVRQALAAREAQAGAAKAPAVAGTPAEEILALLPGDTEITPVALSGVRKRVAARMLASLQETAQLTLHRHGDARALLAFRQSVKRSPAHLEVADITLNDLVLFVVARSLLEHPDLNALFVGDTLYRIGPVHLGVAVDTPRGLLVPVLHHAERLGLRTLSQRARGLIEQSRDGRVAPEALQGGSFTVTNLGGLGIERFTPVLNPPQVAILGVGAIVPRAVTVEGETAHQPQIGLSLTINHQVVDGAPAARFLQTLAEHLANPELLLLS